MTVNKYYNFDVEKRVIDKRVLCKPKITERKSGNTGSLFTRPKIVFTVDFNFFLFFDPNECFFLLFTVSIRIILHYTRTALGIYSPGFAFFFHYAST